MRSVTNWPEIASAVATTPASAITKNIPLGPETPKRSSTTEDTITVSMVMPEIGFLAVIAIALAATEVKKKENSSVSARPISTASSDSVSVEKKTPAASVETTTPASRVTTPRSRSVRSWLALAPDRNVRAATAKDAPMILSDFRIPKMPAVAMAPTPMKRT